MSRIAIISGGEYSPLRGIEEHDFVIACDRGLDYARRWGVTPDLILGDFDSFEGEVTERAEVCRLPREKDDTDTVYAVRRALSMGAREISLYCALGGRLDHLIANLQTLGFIAENGARGHIIDDNTEIFAFTKGSVRLPKREGCSLSVLSLTDVCTGVSIEGAKYPLNKAVVRNTFPVGVSNEWKDDVTVSVETGILMVMLCKMQ